MGHTVQSILLVRQSIPTALQVAATKRCYDNVKSAVSRLAVITAVSRSKASSHSALETVSHSRESLRLNPRRSWILS